MNKFKIGDLVTPDPNTFDVTYTSLMAEVGNTFRVVKIDEEEDTQTEASFDLDKEVGESDQYGWLCKHWKLAKHQIIKDIIADL